MCGLRLSDSTVERTTEATGARLACKELGLATSATSLIGDTIETDILGGVQMGYKTILVSSRGSQESDLDRYAYRPDIVVESANSFAGSRRRTADNEARR